LGLTVIERRFGMGADEDVLENFGPSTAAILGRTLQEELASLGGVFERRLVG